MKFEKISKKALVFWELLAVIIFYIILLLILWVFKPYTYVWYGLLFVLGAAFILTTFLYLPLYYLSIEFGINSEAIVYRKGVFFPHTEILYRDRVVFVTIFNNPLTPIFKISSLVISAAGSNLKVLFFDSRRAKEISDILSTDRGL